MTTITTQAQIDSDEKVRLELPTSLRAGPAEVVVVIQPTPERQSARSLSGLFANTPAVNVDEVLEIRNIRQDVTADSWEQAE